MAEHQERIGQHVGDYRLLRWLGGGGFGNVYLASHTRDHTQVALKVLQMRLSNPDDLRSFLNEARMFRLRHPHIMPLLDLGISRQDEPYLVMEYAPKGTLRDRHPKGTRVPLLTILDYSTQVASALHYAHEHHLVHRDVKPENMLLLSDEMLLLSDFGIATTTHSTHSASTSIGIGGTMPYMAPEQLRGHPRAASDQYALAIVIYEWLTGRCPFVGTAVEVMSQHMMQPPPPLLEQVAGLPNQVEDVLFKALAKDHKERFVSVQAFAFALQQASAPPTLLRPDLHAPTDLPPIVSLTNTIPPSLLTPPAILIPSPVTQEPLLSPAEANHEILASHGRSTLIPPHQSSMLPATQISIPPPAYKPSLPKRYSALLVVLALLLMSVVGGYAWRVTTSHLEATATVATLSEATAAANAAINAYTTYVSQHGIMFGFNAEHTHNNPYEHILNVTNVSQVRQVWAASTGGQISSSPAVANGLVYVGSNDNKLHAFDAISGQQKWVASTGGAINSSPAVMDGLVYVGSEDSKLYAFNAMTGEQKWVSSPAGNVIESSPTVANGFVYVGSYDHNLYAFNAMTGEQKWVATTGNMIFSSSPVVGSGLVYVCSGDGKLYAFNASTGQLKWISLSTGTAIYSSPALANGIVYVSSDDGKLVAFDANTGEQRWVAATGGSSTYSSPAIANSLVYVGSNDHKLHAFDANTGKQRWVAATGSYVHSSPTVANGLTYVGSIDHKLYVFESTTGQLKWAAPTGGQIFSSPTVANGFVYVGSLDGKLYAFSLP